MPKLFVTGSCSTSLGSWEKQLGNAAIFLGLSVLVRRELSDVELRTKYRLSETFAHSTGIQPVEGAAPRKSILAEAFRLLGCLGAVAAWRAIRLITGRHATWLLFDGLLREYWSSDLIIDISGDTYGDNIPLLPMLKHSLELSFAFALGKPVIYMANSPGPFSGWLSRWVSARVLSRMSVIAFREPESRERLSGHPIGAPQLTTACPAFYLEIGNDAAHESLMSAEGIPQDGRPRIGITLCGHNLHSRKTWGDPETLEDLDYLLPVLRWLHDDVGASLVFVPHVYRMSADKGGYQQGPDHKILNHVVQKLRANRDEMRAYIVNGIYSPSTIKRFLGSLDLYLTGRLHAGVAALSQGVPTILLAYGHKHTGFARLLKQEARVFSIYDEEALQALVQSTWAERASIRALLEAISPSVLKLAALNVRIVRDLLELSPELRRCPPEELIRSWRQQEWQEGTLDG